MLSLSRCTLPEYTATHFFVFLSVDIWVVSSLGLIRAALALTLYFFFNMMYVLAFTYMCLGEHMCAALVGLSAHRSRRAGSECGNMFDIRRHHQRVSKNGCRNLHSYQPWENIPAAPRSCQHQKSSAVFNSAIPLGRLVIYQCTFNLHCPDETEHFYYLFIY